MCLSNLLEGAPRLCNNNVKHLNCWTTTNQTERKHYPDVNYRDDDYPDYPDDQGDRRPFGCYNVTVEPHLQNDVIVVVSLVARPFAKPYAAYFLVGRCK